MIRRTFLIALATVLAPRDSIANESKVADVFDTSATPAKPAKPVVKKPVTVRVVKGMHSHLCRRCRYEFWHFSGSHTCPQCHQPGNYYIHRYA